MKEMEGWVDTDAIPEMISHLETHHAVPCFGSPPRAFRRLGPRLLWFGLQLNTDFGKLSDPSFSPPE